MMLMPMVFWLLQLLMDKTVSIITSLSMCIELFMQIGRSFNTFCFAKNYTFLKFIIKPCFSNSIYMEFNWMFRQKTCLELYRAYTNFLSKSLAKIHLDDENN